MTPVLIPDSDRNCWQLAVLSAWSEHHSENALRGCPRPWQENQDQLMAAMGSLKPALEFPTLPSDTALVKTQQVGGKL